jgi:hypothetical protein
VKKKKKNQNNQNGFYDINIEGKGQCKHSLPVTVPIKTVHDAVAAQLPVSIVQDDMQV